jgi:aspartyl-tRNA synthetase
MKSVEERILIRDTVQKSGETVNLRGWVDTVRDHGKVVFVDLRDRTGLVQCVITDADKRISNEAVIDITGKINERPENAVNPEMETGTVEVLVDSYEILNDCDELPIPIDTDGYEISEDMRLKYRYLDLRRKRLNRIIRLRSDFVQALRKAFFEKDFVEVETPLLTKGTSEGCRNFIVPSRLNPGKFYALPQSPQQYKQMLMTSGFERYFQVAKCIRDEDLKADRGFEHTQFDVEMSFVTEEDVMRVVEEGVKQAVTEVGGKLKDDPFPVIGYDETMKKYGDDKFDLRTEQEKKDGVLAFAWVVRFPFFKQVDTDDAAEVEESRSGWVFTHNPFSRPIEEHIPWHLAGEHIGDIRTTQYDLVCNGMEAGGGSIRAHESEVLRSTYMIMGYSETEIEDSVGHMLRALDLGTPPHGGIALGVDRLIMLLAGEESLKETVAFPMSGSGKTAVTNAPSEVPEDQLKELGIQVQQGETDVVFIKLKKLLDAKNVKYEVIEHKPVKTSEEAAKVRNTLMSQSPKAMVLEKENGELILVSVPADRQVDLDAVSKAAGGKVRIASADTVEESFGIKVGAVPPFGRLFNIEMYLDKAFWEMDDVVFNAGRRDRSIKMKASDLIEVSEPNKISQKTDFKK